jgi:death-on-curing protein
MSDPLFLTSEQIQYLHRLSLEAHGGQDGLRDPAAFESAVVQPHNTWLYAQGDLFDVAAAYAFHLAESQAFIDGNKRTGMAAALVFLRINKISIGEATETLHQAMIGIAKREIAKPQLAAIFRTLAART